MQRSNIPCNVRLTACDHEQNGFVHLALWRHGSEAQARYMIEAVDASVDANAEPDSKTAAFAFILDLVSGDGDCHDTGKRMLPTQIAQRLAPAQVSAWLTERPDPGAIERRDVPELATASLLRYVATL
jgi:hypothetical protein